MIHVLLWSKQCNLNERHQIHYIDKQMKKNYNKILAEMRRICE